MGVQENGNEAELSSLNQMLVTLMRHLKSELFPPHVNPVILEQMINSM